jgi:hypothetical protein
MDRLSLVLILATGPVIAGGLIITLMSFGLYGWAYLLPAGIIGWLLAWPAGYVISRRIKRQDPNFDHTKGSYNGVLPDPSAPEA